MTPFALLQARAGLDDREAADVLHVREDTVRHWRTGRREPRPPVLYALARVVQRNQDIATALERVLRDDTSAAHGSRDAIASRFEVWVHTRPCVVEVASPFRHVIVGAEPYRRAERPLPAHEGHDVDRAPLPVGTALAAVGEGLARFYQRPLAASPTVTIHCDQDIAT